ncbi:MAG: gph [Firmicutes bacterium]|nr:gph [Bacillota bacterium]
MEKRPYKAAIFDLDGTLLNTLDDIADACNQVLREAGCQAIATAHYQVLVGSGARHLVTTAVHESQPGWTQDQIEPVYQAYRKLYANNWHNRTAVYAGVLDLLEKLQAAGIRLAVLSNKPHEDTQAMVNHYFPTGLFASCYGQLEPYPTKPDPTLALAIASAMGVEPSAVAFIGDSGSDMKTAVNAGMTGIGVLWGFRSADELINNGAAVLARDPEELNQLLMA